MKDPFKTKQPFKISITQHGVTKSVEIEHSEITIEEFINCLLGLLASTGYHEESLLRDLEEAAREEVEAKFPDKQ